MKTKKWPYIMLILALFALSFSSSNSTDLFKRTKKASHIVVLLKFKAQPEKGSEAVLELTKLIEKVKTEPHFIKITLHVDATDPSSILLYEEWADDTYYNTEHMNTDHIKQFMLNSQKFLMGPPDITFWKVKQVFK